MIDLASSYGDPCCSPCNPTSEADKKFYPNFHYDGDKDLDLPEEGTMVIKFKRTSKEERERDGKKRYGCSVDVIAIDSVEASEVEAPSKNYDDASSALDKIAEALEKKKSK